MADASPGLHGRRHRRRRRLPDRLHLRHHRRAEGHDALPSRHAGDLRRLLRATCSAPSRDDLFIGSPPLAFTSASAGSSLFPMRIGASTVLLEKRAAGRAPAAIARYRARSASRRRPPIGRCSASSPSTTSRRLRKCVSAGEALPQADVRGLAEPRPASRSSTASARPRCCTSSSRAPRGRDPPRRDRQAGARLRGEDRRRARARPAAGLGRPACGARADRLPLSRRRAAAQIRRERLEHHRRHLPDGRGRLFLVPGALRRHDRLRRLQHRRAGGRGGAAGPSGRRRMRRRRRARRRARHDRQGLRGARTRHDAGPGADAELQDLVKAEIAPYKYPRAIEFVDALPRTQTGKLQRFELRRIAGPSGRRPSATAAE